MDDEIVKRFGKKTELKSAVIPIYPRSAEREMQRLVGAYFSVISKEVRALRLDDKNSRLETLAFGAAMAVRLKKVASQVESQALREWKRCVRETLGIELPDSYYLNGLYVSETNKWLLDMMKQLSELPGAARQAAKKVMQQYVGKGIDAMRRAVGKKLASLKRQAKARATAAVAWLFGALSRTQQRDSGCGKYYWKTMRDDRVRPCHRALDGRIFRWDNPPAMWVETKHGRRYTGRRCNPGEDWGCRCIAIPVFDISSLKLPDMEE